MSATRSVINLHACNEMLRKSPEKLTEDASKNVLLATYVFSRSMPITMNDSIRLKGERKRKRHEGFRSVPKTISVPGNMSSSDRLSFLPFLLKMFDKMDWETEEKGQRGKQEVGNRETWRWRVTNLLLLLVLEGIIGRIGLGHVVGGFAA